MFYLITGTPGSGKTLLTIAELSKITDRPVYYHDINLTELGRNTLKWTSIDLIGVMKWRELPPNSIVLIDESHKVFPVRSSTQKPPEWIEALAEHRHLGIDFYLLTQHPMDLDVFVRRRVYQHIHYKRQFGYESCTRFRWEGLGDPDDKFRIKDASSTRVSYPKQFYDYYVSADAHTFRKEIPKQFWYTILTILLVCVLMFVAYRTLFHSSLYSSSVPADQVGRGEAVAGADTSGGATPSALPVSVNSFPSDKLYSRGRAVPAYFSNVKSIYTNGFVRINKTVKTWYLAVMKDGSRIKLSSDLIVAAGGTIQLIDDDCFHTITFDTITFDTTCPPVVDDDSKPSGDDSKPFADAVINQLAGNDAVTAQPVSKPTAYVYNPSGSLPTPSR